MDVAWLEQHALRYVARWESSAAGVASLLERKVRERCERTDESAERVLATIPSVVDALVERGYVDDRRYADGLFERLRRHGTSMARIRATMLGKGVGEEILQEVLAEVEPNAEITAAWKLAQRRGLGPHCKDESRRAKDRERHLGILARQGFDLETALGVVDAETIPESR